MPKIKLTKTDVSSAVVPDAGSVDYQFESVPGLVLRVTAGGARTFYVLKRIRGGKLIREKIGKYPSISTEQARVRACALIAALERGDDPTQSRREIRGAPTVNEAFQLFVRGKRNKRGEPLSPRTVRDYQNDFRLYWSSIADRKLPTISSDEIERIYLAQGIKTPRAANRSRAMLSSFFEWCLASRLIDGNPVKLVRKAFVDTERERFLSGEELRRFFAAMSDINPDARDFFLMALLTGARRANVQEMDWKDVDLQSAEWRIARTKNGTSQIVVLTPEAVHILKLRKQNNSQGYVFPGNGKTGHLVEPKKAWAKLLQKAGIDDLRLHDLRRTLGSWQAKTGASLAIVGKSLNHKSLHSTRVYARLDLDPVRQSVTRATDAMAEAAGVGNLLRRLGQR